MIRKHFYLVNLMMFLCLFMGTQNICHGLEFDVAEPVPGFSPTLWIAFNYVNTDANFMLLQVWDPYWRIESSTWDPNTQQWTSPQQLPTDPPGGFPTGTGIASLSPDGMTMFYGAEGYSGVCRSWWTPNGWTLPPKTDPNLDPLASDTYFNGKYLFTSHFYFDIWVSTYDDANGQFSPSVPVKSITTSEWSEQGAWISSDSSLLIFCSDRPGGYGLHDLYSATWDEDLKIWTNITNLGPNVNTSLDEYNSCMAEEAGILFFERIDPNTGYKRQPMQAVVKPAPIVKAAVDITPDVFEIEVEPDSEAEEPEEAFLRCFIELEDVASAENIDVSTVSLSLNETILATAESPLIVDNVLEVIFRLDLANVSNILGLEVAGVEADDEKVEIKTRSAPSQAIDLIELTVSGELIGGGSFSGTDAIRVAGEKPEPPPIIDPPIPPPVPDPSV